ncbi:hypothetical protein HPP92_010426 [Vanilla planifolia]|uniref:Uncharacterized protein n=1 Tax=Vanilla planifolia TaxID=51239 RepID=A0A835R9D0_VANPL|nr:hypothetical protein HPP92_010426 [Vanilla planifolia]
MAMGSQRGEEGEFGDEAYGGNAHTPRETPEAWIAWSSAAGEGGALVLDPSKAAEDGNLHFGFHAVGLVAGHPPPAFRPGFATLIPPRRRPRKILPYVGVHDRLVDREEGGKEMESLKTG